MSANDEHRGPSDPGSYSVSCKHERMTALMRTGLERYNAEMARVAAERERQAKDAALQVQRDVRRSRYIPLHDPKTASLPGLLINTFYTTTELSATNERGYDDYMYACTKDTLFPVYVFFVIFFPTM